MVLVGGDLDVLAYEASTHQPVALAEHRNPMGGDRVVAGALLSETVVAEPACQHDQQVRPFTPDLLED